MITFHRIPIDTLFNIYALSKPGSEKHPAVLMYGVFYIIYLYQITS